MPGLKGFISKGQKVQGTVVPEELKDVPTPQAEFLEKKPGPVTTAIKDMFKSKKESLEKSTKPLVSTVGIEPTKVEAKVEKVKEVEEKLEESYDETLKKLEKLIVEEDKGDHYENEIPGAYVPESRRGFSEFIKQEYDDFTLKPIGEQDPVASGDAYPYQKFIREYIRQSSPYRGILVYHGLGSGKTCTAIAASEALFSTSNKKIIVMTPFSLRKNFLKEITFCGFHHFRLQNYCHL